MSDFEAESQKECRPLVVRCKNWTCEHKIVSYKRQRNGAGRREYCSKECFRVCPPSMRRAAETLNLKIDAMGDPVGEFVYTLGTEIISKGWRATSERLGVSVNTLKRWMAF